jgi:hypothetical protein
VLLGGTEPGAGTAQRAARKQLNNLDNSVCSTAARQHATGKTCDPRAKSIIMCFEVFRQ